MIQAQIHREWGVAIVQGRAEYASPWSKVARGKHQGAKRRDP